MFNKYGSKLIKIFAPERLGKMTYTVHEGVPNYVTARLRQMNRDSNLVKRIESTEQAIEELKKTSSNGGRKRTRGKLRAKFRHKSRKKRRKSRRKSKGRKRRRRNLKKRTKRRR